MRPLKYKKGKKPPAFISNLYKILDEPDNSPYIKWRDDQESFIILNIPKFSQIVLPKYYKHSNYSSFVRQLNMYNFNKMRSDFQGENIYRNDHFAKNSYEGLKNIRRREVVTNKNNPVTNNEIQLLASAIGLMQNQSDELEVEIDDNLMRSKSQQNHFNELAAPSPQLSFFDHFAQIQNLKLAPSVSDYLQHSNPIPQLIPLKKQSYFPLKTMVDQMKLSQSQLQEVCISLYEQNRTLTSENKRLQEKLKSQFKRKEQILNQIIKYVINFLSQWNSHGSSEVDEDKFSKENMVSDDQSSSSDAVLDSYDLVEKRKFQKGKGNKKDGKKSKFTFSQYAQNQKKILLALLKQIQKSYNEKFFFSGNSNVYHSQKPYKFQDKNPQFQNSYNSPNNFLMQMLLKFIQSNNLNEVIKRFSSLINLERNKKSKNFTIVNCMKDLKEHFRMEEQSEIQWIKGKRIDRFQKIDKIEFEEKSERFLDQEKFLQHEKETINQMEKQLALMSRRNNTHQYLKFLEMNCQDFQEKQSSHINFVPEKIIRNDSNQSSKSFKLFLNREDQLYSPKINIHQKIHEPELSDFEEENSKFILEKFNFRLE